VFKMLGYLKLIRPLNCVMGAVAVFIAAFITAGNAVPEALYLSVTVAMIVVVLFMAAGNTLNDYYDRDTDKVNHPNRPIPAGKVKPMSALKLAGVLFGIAIAISILINIEAFLVVLVNAGLSFLYELKLKKHGLPGNIAVSWLTATLFFFGGLAVYSNMTELMTVSTLALLAFTASLGREITKDIEDLEGDVDRKTLPKRIGPIGAAILGGSMFIVTAILSIIPLWLNLFEYWYIVVIIFADVIFIYCGFLVFENPSLTSNMAKAGMVMALAAFIAGGMGV
jgi:geranylgeranylglycerol-phosphate geranylgeranyltransferase